MVSYDPGYTVWRSFLIFDTSGISSVVSAYIAILIKGNHLEDDDKMVIQNGQPIYPHNPPEVGDYDMTNYSGNGGELESSEITEYAWNTIVLNETGISWINCGGYTKLCLRSQQEIDGTEPLEDRGFIDSVNPPLLYITEPPPAGRSFGTIIG